MCDAVKKLVEEERAEERANIDSRIAEAVAEGIAEEKEKTARIMLGDGNISPKDVSRYLSMPLGKVKSIASSMGI